ncbi:MAG: hypothetical protein RL011_641 [Pseudomonadota bacterium]|jgi:hypothetical protein
MGNQGRRRGFASWFVEPYKQVRLGLVVLLVNFVFAALIFGVFGYYLYDVYEAVSVYFKLSDGESIVTMKKFAVPLISCASLIVLFVLTTILVSVRFTHQIYGPLVSIHRYLDEVLAGSVPQPIQLRESDQLKDLADKLNSVAERMAVDQRAGTMVAVYRFLDELGEGKKPQPIKLRDNDRMTELVEKLNKIAGKIS